MRCWCSPSRRPTVSRSDSRSSSVARMHRSSQPTGRVRSLLAGGPAERFANVVRAPEADVPRSMMAALCISASVRRPGRRRMVRPTRRAGRAVRGRRRSTGCVSSCSECSGSGATTSDYRDPRNSFLDAVIDRRRGIPITLSVVLIEVARRLGIAVHGIGMPGHFLVQETARRRRSGATRSTAACCSIATVRACAVRGHDRGDPPAQDDAISPAPPSRAILARMLANLEHGPLAADPPRLAWMLRAAPRHPRSCRSNSRSTLLRRLARGRGARRSSTRAYETVAERAPDDAGARAPRRGAVILHARWN